MGNYHSKTLSPSDAHIWLHCPYSEYLSDLVPSYVLEKSDASYKKIKKAGKQGTVAHKVVEMILQRFSGWVDWKLWSIWIKWRSD